MSNLIRLGDHTTKIGSGQTPRGGHRSYSSNGIALIRSQNVLMGAFSYEGLAFISDAIDDEMEGSRVLQGDVLLNITGASIGRVCVVPDEICPANVNQHVCIIRCKDSLDPDYVAAILASPRYQNIILESQAGGTRQALTKQMVENFEIPWRPLNEQRRIAARLKAQLAEVNSARQAALAQAQDITQLRSRMLAEIFGNLDVEPATLGDVVLNIQSGKSFQTAETPAPPDQLGVLKVSAISWSAFRADEAKALNGEYHPEDHHRVYQGDLLISRANTKELVGAVVLVERHYPLRLLSDKTLRLVIDEERASKEYLLYALRATAARTHIEHFATGTSDSMRNISQGVITSTPIPLPPLSQQRSIAETIKARLTEIEFMHRAVKAQLQDIQSLPLKFLSIAFEN